ncbi:hypothetical protein H6P81_010117 [Aristolochia fimbriata]|uniref:Uncharacterized protein n=1 Tax=Aristolochia fimbriata TaxID=158543 RepID=A0AAV7ER84_ARIFI|nr:hypothetical protein H6P81_010117 [Aristolochia fimbriata]
METVQILSSPTAPEVAQEEVSPPEAIVQIDSYLVAALEGTEVAEDLAEVAPTQPEISPVQEVTPPVVQEVAEGATIEEEAPAPVVEEMVEIEVLTVQEEASVIQEEAPIVEEVPSVVEEVAPIEEQAPVVQETASLPLSAPPALTSLATPSQQLLSHVEGVMLQVWKDQITPRMLSPDAVRDASLAVDANFIISKLQEVSHDVTRLQVYTQKLQALREIESLARERDWAESDAWEALEALSSKLENAEITLDEAAEELSEAKVDEEDARERLELAREQLQSAGTNVVYLTTQVEQIRESVRDLKKVVVEAEQKVAEVIARPTLSAAEEATLLSSRAAFAELQQEMTKGL